MDWKEVVDDVFFALPACYSSHTAVSGARWPKIEYGKLKTLIGKCKKLVASFHMSCKATELLENEADGQTGR